jgi:regulator of sirC expression with transglutaminase-like and TPR domain
MGVTYQCQGKYREAIAHFKKYLELAPQAKDFEKIKAEVHRLEKEKKKSEKK